MFRSRVSRGRRRGTRPSQTQHRRGIHNNTPAPPRRRVQRLLLQHLPNLRLLTEKHPVQIHRHHILPVLQVDIDGLPRLPADACIVDPDVYPAELLDGFVDGGVDGVFSSGVELEVDDIEVRVVFLELGGGGFERGGLDVAEGELADAVAGEGVGCVLADAFRGVRRDQFGVGEDTCLSLLQ